MGPLNPVLLDVVFPHLREHCGVAKDIRMARTASTTDMAQAAFRKSILVPPKPALDDDESSNDEENLYWFKDVGLTCL